MNNGAPRVNVFASTKRERECKNCRDRSVIIYDSHSGDELCAQCGLILEARVMSEEQEWRNFSNADGGSGGDRSRVGGPNDSWFDEAGIGTSVLGGDKKFQRLSQTHDQATSGGDRQLKTAFNNLRLIAEAFGIRENTTERCKEMIKSLQMSNNLKNRTGIVHMLAVVYLASKEDGSPRSLKELLAYDRTLELKDLARSVNRIKKVLPARNSQQATYASAELMSRFCSRLQLSHVVTYACEFAARKAEILLMNQGGSNRAAVVVKPNILAGSIIYLISQLFGVELRLSDITEATKGTVSAIQSTYKDLLPNAKMLLPSDFTPLNFGGFNSLKPQ